MDKKRKFWWKWNTLIIDFEQYQDTRNPHNDYDWMENEKKFPTDGYKLNYGLYFVGFPDLWVHKWSNGDYSSEYNEGLNFLIELGLIKIIDYELEKEDK